MNNTQTVNTYQICTRCLMDTTATDIVFDEYGVCNYCTEFLKRSGHLFVKEQTKRQQDLNKFIAKVKAGGKGKPYDCVVGISGGVDSSLALVNTVKLGLRPLAVHMDNGWNSELTQNNIANLVRTLNVDLYTHVINWDEYRKLMQSFFDADVIDVELLYDNAMVAVNFRQAAKYGVQFILAGTNQATEGMLMPPNWNWCKYDKRQIKALAQKFGGTKLNTFPAIGTFDLTWYLLIRRIRWVSFLDYFDYNKFKALEVLQKEYGYKPYPYKHYESIFTRFYQGYILPQKFGIDKRRVHLSTLIASGQITLAEGMKGMEGIPYPSSKALEEDIEYFIKKMNWTPSQLQKYINRPQKSHKDYPSEEPLWNFSLRCYRKFFKLG